MGSKFNALGVILLGLCHTSCDCIKSMKKDQPPKSNVDAGYTLNGKAVTMTEVQALRPAAFYELERRKAEILREQAGDAYLDSYFTELGKTSGKSKEAAKAQYVSQQAVVADQEVNNAIASIGDRPPLTGLTAAQKMVQMREMMVQSKTQQATRQLIDEAIREKKLVIDYPTPVEPIYTVTVDKSDIVRSLPKTGDAIPSGCRGDDCLITVVEYCNVSMPFCVQMTPLARSILEKYQGKIRWVFRNFAQEANPISQAAAVAGLCAARQQKFWPWYEKMTNRNTPETGSKASAPGSVTPVTTDLLIFNAKESGLDMNAFVTCTAAGSDVVLQVSEQAAAARSLGVMGAPTIFINGKKMSGVIPQQMLEKQIEELISKK